MRIQLEQSNLNPNKTDNNICELLTDAALSRYKRVIVEFSLNRIS